MMDLGEAVQAAVPVVHVVAAGVHATGVLADRDVTRLMPPR